MDLSSGRRSIWDLPGNDTAEESGVAAVEIPLDKLLPNPFNPRLAFDEEEVEALKDSILADGLLQELMVCEALPFVEFWRARLQGEYGEPEDLEKLEGLAAQAAADNYVILIGHTRREGCGRAGLETARSNVRNDKISRARILGLPENMRRVGLNPIEQAIGFSGALKDGLTQVELAQQTGAKQPYISRRLKLLRLGTTARAAILDGRLGTTAAEALADELADDLVLQDKAVQLLLANASMSVPVAVATVRKPQPNAAPAEQRSRVAGKTVPPARSTAERTPAAAPPPATGAAAGAEHPPVQPPAEPAERSQETATFTGTDRPQTQTPEAEATETEASAAEADSILGQGPDDPAEEAADRRTDACLLLIAANDLSNPRDLHRVLAPAMLLLTDEARDLAADWLAETGVVDNRDEPGLFDHVIKRGDAKLTAQVALAVALAVYEQRARQDGETWDQQTRAYLDYLVASAGYEPTAWESDRLG
ncbi:ParB N-terminal domain-containing protein [Kitasatospora purpeofusca]|uniref:ParB/RepB/Spo0J family partition protein n=1 Tax=Kitasatospora purpeofusca TaxID=67352 RepID=UPI0035DA684C